MVATATSAQKESVLHRGLGAVWFVVRVGGMSYILVLAAALLLEDRLVYMPAKYPAGDWPTPLTDGQLPIEDVELLSQDGTALHGWFVPHPAPIAHVLFLHGNAENVTAWRETLWRLHHTVGASVFIIDYRGFGRSEGSPSETGIVQDARAARRWLANRADLAEAEIVLIGRSLGGGVAVQLAAELPPRALILERTFTTLPDAAASRYPFLPTRLCMRNRFDSLNAISRYRGPLLQSHGDRDEVIPLALGRQLFAASPSSRKEFLVTHGLGHNDSQPASYYGQLRAFLAACH